MKRLLLLAMLLPFAGFAQPINTMNNPNQPGYQIPSQQRMQTQMQTQQIQQKGCSTNSCKRRRVCSNSIWKTKLTPTPSGSFSLSQAS